MTDEPDDEYIANMEEAKMLNKVENTEVVPIPGRGDVVAPSQSGDKMLEMIDRVCSDPNFDMSKMEKLIDMRNNELERVARIGFGQALSAMQDELPIIEKKGVVEYKNKDSGKMEKAFKHAKFEDVIEAIAPVLKRHGFSLLHQTRAGENNLPILRTTLMHTNGHSESTERSSQADTSGGKNNLQGWGSTTSYLKRYNVFDLLGLAARDEDNDGKNPPETITDLEAGNIEELICESGSNKELFFRRCVSGVVMAREIPTKDYPRLVALLEAKIKQKAKKKEAENADS